MIIINIVIYSLSQSTAKHRHKESLRKEISTKYMTMPRQVS